MPETPGLHVALVEVHALKAFAKALESAARGSAADSRESRW